MSANCTTHEAREINVLDVEPPLAGVPPDSKRVEEFRSIGKLCSYRGMRSNTRVGSHLHVYDFETSTHKKSTQLIHGPEIGSGDGMIERLNLWPFEESKEQTSSRLKTSDKLLNDCG